MCAEDQISYNLLCSKFRSAERDRRPRTNAAAAGLQNPRWKEVWHHLRGGVGACPQHEVFTLRRRVCVHVQLQNAHSHRLKLPLTLAAETNNFISALLR